MKINQDVKEGLMFLSVVSSITSAIIGVASAFSDKDCTPTNIASMLNPVQRITCEVFKPRWDKPSMKGK